MPYNSLAIARSSRPYPVSHPPADATWPSAAVADLCRLVDAAELGADGMLALCRRALALRAGATPLDLSGKRVAALFCNPSLRTRTSMAAACQALGASMSAIDASKDAWKLEYEDGAVMDDDKAEHVSDAARVLSHYHDLVAVRAFAGLKDAESDRADTVINAFARHAEAPFISLESAVWHPLQGLADASTWLHHLGRSDAEKPLQGVPITLTWAPHPKALGTAVGHQVLLSAALLGMDVTVAHPERFDLDPQVVSRASSVAGTSGGSVRIEHDQDKALRGAQVVVAKSWGGFSGYGRREQEATERAKLGHWTVDAENMQTTDNAGFMHCLPVRRNVVVTDEVIDGPNSWVHETAALRMWTAMATLEAMLG